ncbi:hypothetical protein MCUN1_003318 [Malassezia cuniculi]|uniref:Ricin B lectin domain-containing protein n=1 Tax=Malassezia cuniculi TaxID=948313 RepID=A0AAF0EXS4_9BASI|nr:hypothetical protein MCUN1_003318 [Malassezia cuniculi]
MFSKTFSLFVALSLSVAQVMAAPVDVPVAAPSPVTPDVNVSNQTSVATPNNRIVTSISCDGGYSQTGTLSLNNGALSIGNNNELTSGGNGVQFTFNECTSSLMNLGQFADENSNVHYGHISLTSNADQCLAAERLGEDNAHIHQTDCSKPDDSSQFTQFWKLTTNGGNANVEFLGHINDGRNPYVLGQDGDVVSVSPTGEASVSVTLSSDNSSQASKTAIANAANRIVNSIKCSGGYTKTGALAIDGQGTLGLSDGSPADVVIGGSDSQFTFTECTSQLLGNDNFADSDASTVYGIVQVGDSTGKDCLRAAGLLQKLAPIEVDYCSYSDDSSQMMQFWEYKKGSNVLSFVGKATISSGAQYGANLNGNVLSVTPDSDNSVNVKFN